MSFGDILEKWEIEQKQQERKSRKGRNASSGNPGKKEFSNQLDRYFESHQEWEQFIKEKEEAVPAAPPGAYRSTLRRMAPEDSLDLHGMTRNEAWTALENFFHQSRRRSLRKVLIIHGKGNHSGNRAVLPELVSTYLRRSPHAGESGKADKENGGSGATWVIIV